MNFKPHSPAQELVLFSKKPIVVCATGIQFGKTFSGVIWLKIMMHTYTAKDDNFIICSPTFPILTQSTLPPFLSAMEGLGTYNKQLNCFKMTHGGSCWFRTGRNPDSIVGITNVRAILCDEAGLFSLYFWENIQARAAFKQAPIRIVTSPYSMNWLFKDLIRPHNKGNKDVQAEVELIQAKSTDNPYFPLAYYEKKRKTMDPRRFNMMFGGEFDKMEGLVYDVFEDDLNICTPFALPYGTRFVGGLDWGFTDPFVMTIRAITPDGKHYQVFEYYKSGLTITDMVDMGKRAKSMWPIERFYADPSMPAYILDFNRNGLTTVKANNDIRIGIDRHYELIKSRRYKCFSTACKYTLDEYEQYHYPEYVEVGPNKDVKDHLPVDQHNHLMDANRYISIATHDSMIRRNRVINNNDSEPMKKDPTVIDLLKSSKNNNIESWN